MELVIDLDPQLFDQLHVKSREAYADQRAWAFMKGRKRAFSGPCNPHRPPIVMPIDDAGIRLAVGTYKFLSSQDILTSGF